MFSPMAPVLPHTTVGDLHGLQALLVLLADPKAAHKRLEELHAAAADVDQKTLDHNAVLATSLDAQNAASDKFKELEAAKAEHDKRLQSLNDYEFAIKAREDMVAQREADHKQQADSLVSSLVDRERAVTQREKSVREKENVLAAKAKRLEADIRAYDIRAAKLREAVG